MNVDYRWRFCDEDEDDEDFEDEDFAMKQRFAV